MNRLIRKNTAGFTILELMVATSIFAVVLLVLTVGIMSFSRDYFRGVNRGSTQAIARQIIDDITQSIQFGKAVTPLTSGTSQGLCVDNTLYSYTPGYQTADAINLGKHQVKYGLVKTVGSNCSGGPLLNTTTLNALPAQNSHDLLGKGMRVADLTVQQVSSGVYSIRVSIAFGDDDLFTPAVNGATTANDWKTLEKCSGGIGSQFCATSDLSTVVTQRIK